jgi:hypothetical protein
VKDAQIKLRKEECAFGMGQKLKLNYAAVKDAQIKSSKKECAFGMGQRRKTNSAVSMDVPIKQNKEEYAFDMGQSVIPMTNLQYSDCNFLQSTHFCSKGSR